VTRFREEIWITGADPAALARSNNVEPARPPTVDRSSSLQVRAIAEPSATLGSRLPQFENVVLRPQRLRTMADRVASHYSERLKLADAIADKLRSTGKDLNKLTTADLVAVDEFHIRGRKATLELSERMNLNAHSHVLDIGSGLGGPARTLAETYGCQVTGIDLTQAFCDAATAMCDWVGLGSRVSFRQGDATKLPFGNQTFDAAMTIHVAMNIAAKNEMYMEACRVLKSGGVFAVYDVLQGEGGEVLYPVPWARDPSISHLATPDEMKSLLTDAGFKLLWIQDSTEESQSFFEKMTAQMAKTGTPPVIWQLFLGDDFPAMARNQVRNVTERRIRTVTYICVA